MSVMMSTKGVLVRTVCAITVWPSFDFTMAGLR